MQGLVEYPFKLGNDRWAFIRLPAETITPAEYDRLAAMLKTLILEPVAPQIAPPEKP